MLIPGDLNSSKKRRHDVTRKTVWEAVEKGDQYFKIDDGLLYKLNFQNEEHAK